MQHVFLKHSPLDLHSLSIETPRCILRPFHMDGVDFEALTRDFCDANRDLYVSPLLPTVEQEKDFIQHAIAQREAGEVLQFFIYKKDSQDIIGSCGLTALTSNEPSIGLWIVSQLHRQGYGSEVYRALIGWTCENTHFTFLRHGCRPENIPSQELAKKFSGVLQDDVDKNGTMKFYIPLT